MADLFLEQAEQREVAGGAAAALAALLALFLPLIVAGFFASPWAKREAWRKWMFWGGTAVLFASSELEEVLMLADRVLVMHDGGIAGDLPVQEASEEAIMRLATGGGAVATA